MRWNQLQVTEFVRMYKQAPCLWNPESIHYKNKEKRDSILARIAASMKKDHGVEDANVTECKTKIKNIRSHYCQLLKRVKSSIENGEPKYVPTIPWFNEIDEFLRDIIHHHKEEPSTNDKATYLSFQVSDDENEDSEDNDNTFIKGEFFDNELEEVEKVPVKRKNSFENSYVVVSADDPLDASRAKKSRTEFDLFGESVALQLNNMPLGDALEIQLLIQQLLTQHRLKKLNKKGDYSIGACTSNSGE